MAVKDSINCRDVELSLKNDYVHAKWEKFPFYSKNDTKFRHIRDVALGSEKYTDIMDIMMRNMDIDVKEFSSDLWMTAGNIKDLHSLGHIIGLHSHTHPTVLSDLSPIEQQREYELNYKFLHRLLGERPKTVSHPCNSYDKRTLSILKDLGIELGFRANMEDHNYSEFEFPREDHANIIKRI